MHPQDTTIRARLDGELVALADAALAALRSVARLAGPEAVHDLYERAVATLDEIDDAVWTRPRIADLIDIAADSMGARR